MERLRMEGQNLVHRERLGADMVRLRMEGREGSRDNGLYNLCENYPVLPLESFPSFVLHNQPVTGPGLPTHVAFLLLPSPVWSAYFAKMIFP